MTWHTQTDAALRWSANGGRDCASPRSVPPDMAVIDADMDAIATIQEQIVLDGQAAFDRGNAASVVQVKQDFLAYDAVIAQASRDEAAAIAGDGR